MGELQDIASEGGEFHVQSIDGFYTCPHCLHKELIIGLSPGALIEVRCHNGHKGLVTEWNPPKVAAHEGMWTCPYCSKPNLLGPHGVNELARCFCSQCGNKFSVELSWPEEKPSGSRARKGMSTEDFHKAIEN